MIQHGGFEVNVNINHDGRMNREFVCRPTSCLTFHSWSTITTDRSPFNIPWPICVYVVSLKIHKRFTHAIGVGKISVAFSPDLGYDNDVNLSDQEDAMSVQVCKEEYLKALKMGQREAEELRAAGKSENPAVLDELLPEIDTLTVTDVGTMDIPAERIVAPSPPGGSRRLRPAACPCWTRKRSSPPSGSPCAMPTWEKRASATPLPVMNT